MHSTTISLWAIFLTTLLVQHSFQGKVQLDPVSFFFFHTQATHFTIMLATVTPMCVNVTKKQ